MDLGQWRVVLNLIDTRNGHGVSAPRFDEERHAGVCSEVSLSIIWILRRPRLTSVLAQIPLRCHHEVEEKPLDRRLLRQGRANES